MSKNTRLVSMACVIAAAILVICCLLPMRSLSDPKPPVLGPSSLAPKLLLDGNFELTRSADDFEVDLGVTERDAHAEFGAISLGCDADGDPYVEVEDQIQMAVEDQLRLAVEDQIQVDVEHQIQQPSSRRGFGGQAGPVAREPELLFGGTLELLTLWADRDAHAEYGTLFLGRDANGDPHGTVDDAAATVALLRLGFQDQIQQPFSRRGSGSQTSSVERELELLKQRIGELETARTAHEDATRTIIRKSLDERGSKITDHVTFGGAIEVLAGWDEDFDGQSESGILLDTAELEFEIQVNDWTLGSLIIEHDDGNFGNTRFSTTEESVDRINVRQALITLGDTQKCWPFATFGRAVVPFGISTGDPVADVLSIEDPLTVEVFETREDFILIGFAFPTPPPPPPTPTTPKAPASGPPQVRPVLVNPLFSKLSRHYCPGLACNRSTPATTSTTPAAPPRTPPPFSGGIYFYNGDTNDRGGDNIEHIGATLGYRTNGLCSFKCLPWSLDMDVDFNSSVFDSRFLEFEYRHFLDQIGFVPGMAVHAKSTVGPVSLVLEWNGALSDAEFTDDLGEDFSIAPGAWQISLGYQFDWNHSVETIGAQGTFLAFGYSESQDLAGATRVIGGDAMRVGFVPKRRFLVTVGEWVAEGLRVAVEYSHSVDYSEEKGGTGRSANGIFAQLTYEW